MTEYELLQILSKTNFNVVENGYCYAEVDGKRSEVEIGLFRKIIEEAAKIERQEILKIRVKQPTWHRGVEFADVAWKTGLTKLRKAIRERG